MSKDTLGNGNKSCKSPKVIGSFRECKMVWLGPRNGGDFKGKLTPGQAGSL